NIKELKESEKIVNAVAAGDLDLGIVGLGEVSETLYGSDIDYHFLVSGKMVVVGNENSYLANKTVIHPKEIVSYPLVLYDDPLFEEIITSVELRYGAANILFKSENIEIIRNAIEENLAVTLLPHYEAIKYKSSIYKEIERTGIESLYQDYGIVLVWSKTTERSELAKSLISLLKFNAENHK